MAGRYQRQCWNRLLASFSLPVRHIHQAARIRTEPGIKLVTANVQVVRPERGNRMEQVGIRVMAWRKETSAFLVGDNTESIL